MPTTLVDTQPSTESEPRKYSSRGLEQAYVLREFASKVSDAIMHASADELEVEALRARALRDASTVFHAAQDETRVCRGYGKPKGVTAANDPSRKAKKPRAPIAPITPAA